MAVLPVTSRRSYRPLAGPRLDLIVLGALLLLLCSSVACGAGSDGDSSTDPTVDASEPGADLFPWLRGQRPERWGYNPLLATGLEDEPLREEPLPDGYRIERVVEGLDRPTHIAVLPDGRLLIAEQAGAIRIVEDGRLLAEPLHTVNAYLPEFEGVIELGLTGLAVDPDFDNHPYVYFYFTTKEPHRSVLQRLAITGDREGEIEELLSWFPAPPCCHVGGGMQFLPDGTLLLGMGDHDEPLLAQNPSTPPGSILRLNRDGSAPSDNPFAASAGDDPYLALTYAYGLRNPYGVAVDPETGRIFAGENGFSGQDALLEIEAGANYGWPGVSLDVPAEEIAEPLIFYHEAAGFAGLEFYSSDVLSDFQGRLFFCRFHTGTVHSVRFEDDGAVAEETIIAEPCHSDIVTGPEGFLYFLDYAEGVLYRIATTE